MSTKSERLPASPVALPEPAGPALDLLHIVRINEEIKRVVAVAFRINIMALNAIFLAKRAGSAARGFGVLSNELRNFSGQLRDTMQSLDTLIHAAVGEVSSLLLESRYADILSRVEVAADGGRMQSGVSAALATREARLQAHRTRLAGLRRELRSAIDDAARLVDLGGVLAKSAKIEAAYGAAFAGPLAQVSGEFDGIVREIHDSLGALQKSGFLRTRS